jgi:hypothetical protein
MTTQWYEDVISPGLVAVITSISGMDRPNAAGANTAVLTYWPTSITGTEPVVSVLYDGHTMVQTGQLFIIDYTPIVRLWVKWQDFQQAEIQARHYADLIPNTITANPYLLGAIKAEPTIQGGTGARIDPERPITRGFVTVGTTTKLIIDFPVRVQIKVATTTLRSLTP